MTIPLNIDVLVLATLAPVIGVAVFWFFQLVSIEIQKRILSKLYLRHKAFCRFTNYIGILFQTICQALGYTVTRSGIASFQLTVDYGEVEPKKEKTGLLGWIARSFLLLGPFFIPAGLVLLISYFIIGKGFVFPMPIYYTFGESLTGFVLSLSLFIKEFVIFLINIDLFNPIHIGFLLVLLFFGFGIRPSYIGEERKEKIDIIHDLKLIKDHLLQKPLYMLAIICFIYIFYLISLFSNPIVYSSVFLIFGWIAFTAIIALLLTYPFLLLIRASDEIRKYWKIVPFLTLVISYIIIRVFFNYYLINQVKSFSLCLMIVVTTLTTILLIKYKRTNRFKTASKMKHMRVADGKKRTSKKRTD